MSTSHPEERQLTEIFGWLSPRPERVDQIERELLALLDAALPQDRILHSLAAEWLALLRSRPVANAALVLAASFFLLLTLPLALAPFALLA
jgi:hypothetical protein